MQIKHRTRLAVRLLVGLASVLLALATLSAVVWAAGGITLTKTDTLIDADHDGLADPGETIQYTLTVHNTNGADVTNVQFNDVLDSNTTLVNGSLNISPLAVDDSYETIGNTLLEVGAPADAAPAVRVTGSVTANDREFLSDTFTIHTYDATSLNGGTVNLQTDGTFTYLPAANFVGNDSFTYTLQDTRGLTGVGVVTIHVVERVWYVNDDAPAGGTGRSTSPFVALSAAQTASAAGDVIYLYSGSYSNGIALKNNQILTGEGLALVVDGYTLRQAGTRPEISSASNLIVLANGNTVQGMNLTNTAGVSLSASGTSGTTSINSVDIHLSGSASGLNLTNQGGTFTYATGSIQGTTSGKGIQLTGGNAALIFQNVPINISTGGSVSIANKTSGAVSFDSASPVTANSTNSPAVVLNGNSTSSFAFNGGMTLTSSSATSLDVNNSGTLTITGPTNTIAATNGTGLSIQNTIIGAGGVTLRSVSASGSANGIFLSNTGSQGIFQITGSGTTNASGGTIQNISANGLYLANVNRIYLNNLTLINANQNDAPNCTFEDNTGCSAAVKINTAADVRLENVDITGTAQTGINGFSVAGFTFRNSLLSSATNNIDEDGIDLRQLSGVVDISNNQISNSNDRGLLVRNSSGSTTLTITGNTFTNVAVNDAVTIDLIQGGTAASDVTFTGNTVQNANGTAFRLNNEGSGAARVWVQTNNITGSGVGVDLTAYGSGSLNYNISGNPQIHADWVGVNIENKGLTATMDGRLENNPSISTSNSDSSAVWVHAEDGGKMVTLVRNNTITGYGFRGIEVESIGIATSVDLTLTGNTVPAASTVGTPHAGIYLQSGNLTGDTSSLCANLTTNSINAAAPDPDVHLRWTNQGTTRFYVQGLTSFVVSSPTSNPVGDFIKSTNTFSDYFISPGTYAAQICKTASFVAVPVGGQSLAQHRPQSQPASLSGQGNAVAGIVNTAAKTIPAADRIAIPSPKKAGLASLLPAWLLRSSGAGEVLSEDLGTLPAGKTLTIRFDASVNTIIAGGVKAISNQAQVSANGVPVTLSDDPDTLAPDDPTLTAHGAAPNLSVTKNDTPDAAAAGAPLTYSITVANNGNQEAQGVLVTETIPAWTTFNAGSSTPGWSCTADTCTFGTGNLAVGSSGSITFAVNVGTQFADHVDNIHNQVAIADNGTGGSDPNTTDNSAVLDTPLNAQPELSLAKTDHGATFMPGETISYTLSFQNTGSQRALNTELIETVPTNTTFAPADSSSGWICQGSGGAGDNCTLSIGNLAIGAADTRIFAVTVANPANGVTMISNTAQVRDDGTNGPELSTINNSATDTTPIRNQAPVFSGLALTPSIDENGIALLTGNISDPEGDALTLRVAWGDGQNSTFTYPLGTASFSATHQYLDDNPSATPSDRMPVHLTLQDSMNGEVTADLETTVNNVDPALSYVAVTPVTENGQAALSGDIADTGTLDTFTLRINWGDGTVDTYTYPVGTTRFSEHHIYLDDPAGSRNTYPILLDLTDDDTGSDTAALDIPVDNVAPIMSGVSIVAANEGAFTVLNASFTDPGTLDTYSLTLNWGDGSAPQQVNLPPSTRNFSISHTYADDDPSGTSADTYSIQLSLSDDDGGTDTAATNVTIRNVAPVMTNLTATGAVEGSPASLTGSITDPGIRDSFTLAVDWGDGSPLQSFTLASGATGFNETHVYVDDNPSGTPADNYTIAVTLTDDDGGNDTDSRLVTVTNAAPLVNAGLDFSVIAGNPFTLPGSFTDAGSADTQSFSWNMGNGDVINGSLNPSYTYPVEGAYTASLRVVDDDGGAATATVLITVAPSADLVMEKTASSASVLLGMSMTYQLVVTNRGPSDASGVTLVDVLPAGLTFVSAPVGCANIGQTITCSIGALPNGDSTSITITAQVALQSPPTLLNTASVTANEADPIPVNNTASASVQVSREISVSYSDFENEIPEEWLNCGASLSKTPRGARGFLGEFGNQTACLTLDNLPEHTQVKVSFDLYIIRSWDGNIVSTPANLSPAYISENQLMGIIGPDRWSLRADGGNVLDTTFSNWWVASWARQAYPGSFPGGDYPPRTGTAEYGTLGYNFEAVSDQDSVYRITRVIDHTGKSLLLEFSASGLQTLADESWGLDNVTVTVMDPNSLIKMYLPVILH